MVSWIHAWSPSWNISLVFIILLFSLWLQQGVLCRICMEAPGKLQVLITTFGSAYYKNVLACKMHKACPYIYFFVLCQLSFCWDGILFNKKSLLLLHMQYGHKKYCWLCIFWTQFLFSLWSIYAKGGQYEGNRPLAHATIHVITDPTAMRTGI